MPLQLSLFPVRLAAGLATLCLLAALAPSSATAGQGLPRLEPTRAVLAPLAFVRYCGSRRADCATGEGATVVRPSLAALNELALVNKLANTTIVPRPDRTGRDVWMANARAGDCEEYVLAKRADLIRRGWPAGALRIAVVRTPDGLGHAVLVVATSFGDLVLDNRHNRIEPFQETGLTFVKVQSAAQPGRWFGP